MDTVRNTIKNVLSLASAELITKLISFIMTILIARYLQDAGFGKYSFAFAFTSFFAIFSDLGLNTLAIREISKDKDLAGKYIGNIIFIKLILSLISFIALAVTINHMSYPKDTTLAVYIIGIFVIITSFTQFYRAIYRAFQKMEYETLTRVITTVSTFCLIILFIGKGYGLVEVSYAHLISASFGFILSGYIVSNRFIKPLFTIDVSLIKNILKEALPFGLTAVFCVINFKIDTVMLSIMKGDSVVGWYNAAYNITEGLVSVVAASVAGACFPLMSKYYQKSQQNLKKIYFQTFQLLFIIGALISILVYKFSDVIINTIYGQQYLNSSTALQILIWAFFIINIQLISSTLLNAVNKQKTVTFITGVGSLLNISLNLQLIPKYSLLGAAYATLVTEIFCFTIYFVFCMRYLNVNYRNVHLTFSWALKENCRQLKKVINKRVLSDQEPNKM